MAKETRSTEELLKFFPRFADGIRRETGISNSTLSWMSSARPHATALIHRTWKDGRPYYELGPRR